MESIMVASLIIAAIAIHWYGDRREDMARTAALARTRR